MRSFDPKTIFREELRELKAYAPFPGKFSLRLDANEAPDLLSAELKHRLAEVAAATDFRRYPDASQEALRSLIATRLGVKATQVIAGVGSDELITLLLTAATRLKTRAPAPTLLTTTPTFVMYRLSARARGQLVMEVPLRPDWDIDETALLQAIAMSEPNIIFIASPNNPTGTMAGEARLRKVIEAAPNSLVVVDEAYVDYAERSQLKLLNEYENVAILRTLSKIGFASLRVGWLVGREDLVAELDKIRLPYNLPTLSQELAATVLGEFSDELDELASKVRQERDRLFSELAHFEAVHPVPSQANFLWLRLDVSAQDVFEDLAKKGVLVRSFHSRGGRLKSCLRVTVGTGSENDRFLQTLQEVL